MKEIRSVANPAGTILGDLNIKLSDDFISAIKRYLDLSKEFGIDYKLALSGVFSMIATVLASFEKGMNITPDIFDTFLTEIRKNYDFHSRRV